MSSSTVVGVWVTTVAQEGVITVADLGEFGLVAAIQALLPPVAGAEVGVGDDAAVLTIPDGRVVASTDLLVEGRHFRRDWSSADDIGRKAAAQNLADIAAMGATPISLLFGLAIPGVLPVEWVLEVTRGMVAECRRAGAAISGGDVTDSDSVMLAITALGDLAGRHPVTRAGARPGDRVAISAAVGRSAAGLALLAAGLPADVPADVAAELLAAHRRPEPAYAAGPLAAQAGATAMIDVSDGLIQDLGHVADASAVSVDVQVALLPGTAILRTTADALGSDWRLWALAGGEDHALAATFPRNSQPPQTWTVIGTVGSGTGVYVDSAPWNSAGGWNHFLSSC